MSNLISDKIFYPILGYEGFYEACSDGTIRSVSRLVNRSRGGLQKHTGKEIKPINVKSGYSLVGLSKNGVRKTFAVHTLIMQAFKGIKNGLVVDHINGNKSDNRLDNLRYCTQRENLSFSKTNPSIFINPQNYKKRFRVRINIGGKLKCFGSYMTIEEAIQARDKQLKLL